MFSLVTGSHTSSSLVIPQNPTEKRRPELIKAALSGKSALALDLDAMLATIDPVNYGDNNAIIVEEGIAPVEFDIAPADRVRRGVFAFIEGESNLRFYNLHFTPRMSIGESSPGAANTEGRRTCSH